MTIMTPVRAPFILSQNALERYAVLQPLTGMFVTLINGDFTIEGTLIHVVRPSGPEAKGPVVALETSDGRIAGPVLGGDLLVRAGARPAYAAA